MSRNLKSTVYITHRVVELLCNRAPAFHTLFSDIRKPAREDRFSFSGPLIADIGLLPEIDVDVLEDLSGIFPKCHVVFKIRPRNPPEQQFGR